MTEETSFKYEHLKSLVRQIGAGYFFENATLDLLSLPYINVAYSSSGEDLWLRQFMKPRLRSGRPGFYVDLGSNDARGTSNSFLFYCHGWRGICIDANLRFQGDFITHRPRDVFVNAAISDTGQSLWFAEHRAGHKMSRVALNSSDFDETFFPAIQVPAMTLADVLRQHVPKDTAIDFMSVDLEDSELPALRSNDWSVFKPRVILIETGTGFDPLKPCDFPTIAFLISHGYRYEGYANNNTLMTSPNFRDPI
jgi:hypothetical protein